MRQDESFMFKLTSNERAELDELAQRLQRSRADAIRVTVKKELEQLRAAEEAAKQTKD